MNDNIFRKKSIERINSPEALNQYLKVANPNIWIFLSAIIILLIGVCIMIIFGSIEDRQDAVVVVSSGSALCVFDSDIEEYVAGGMSVYIDEKEYKLEDVNASAIEINKNNSNVEKHILHLLDKKDAFWANTAVVEGCELKDGEYKAYIVTDQVKLITFIFN